MTTHEALQDVRDHPDDHPGDDETMEDALTALDGRPPDDEDRAIGLWSHLCAAVHERVPDGAACTGGEARLDGLARDDTDTVTCLTCGAVYPIG